MRAWMLGIAILLTPSFTSAQTSKGSPAPNAKGSPQSGKPSAATGKDSTGGGKNAPSKTGDDDMERILRGWESKSRVVRDVECEFRRVTKDTIFKTEEVEYGIASGIKPYQGRLDLKDANGKYRQIFIYTGKRLHQYDFSSKQETIHVLPDFNPATGQSMPGPLGFVYGMSAAEAKARFDMKLIRQFSKDGVDYAEIQAAPRTPSDQQDFKFAQLVIDLRTYLPKELKFVEPNGNEQRWIFDRLETNLNPPVSSKDLQPFDRKEFKELENWKQVVNNFADQPKTEEPPRSKSPTQSKASPDASRTAPPKR